MASVDGFGLLPQEVCILKNNLICGEDDAVGEVWSRCKPCLLLLPHLPALSVHQDLEARGTPGRGVGGGSGAAVIST